MIVFDLKCRLGHQFEAWFRSSDDYSDQQKKNEIECPVCGVNEVTKAISAPNISAKSNRRPSSGGVGDVSVDELFEGGQNLSLGPLPHSLRSELDRVLEKVRDHVESNCEYVGSEFPEEARKIHYGESEERGIYGKASVEESEELLDEGIEIVTLPTVRRRGPRDA